MESRIYIVPVAILAGIFLACFLWLVSTNLVVSSTAHAAPAEQAVQTQDLNGDSGEIEVGSKTEQNVNQSDCLVSPNFPEQILQWCGLISQSADKFNLDPDLLAALIWQESNGDPLAYSHSGAVGLMQVMPRDGLAASFICQNGPCFQDRPSIVELQDPEFNLNYGAKMLARLLKQHGHIREALKYYGPANVDYYYSDIVLSLYEGFRN